jgi:hypothetical protein
MFRLLPGICDIVPLQREEKKRWRAGRKSRVETRPLQFKEKEGDGLTRAPTQRDRMGAGKMPALRNEGAARHDVSCPYIGPERSLRSRGLAEARPYTERQDESRQDAGATK